MTKKSLDQWLNEYSTSHQNPINKLIHKICVPLIILSTIGLLVSLFLPLAIILAVLALIFYIRLSPKLAIIMLFILTISFGLIYWLKSLLPAPLWLISLGVFFIAWILQLIGHKIEGKKPSFADDLIFLLIGPIWVIKYIWPKSLD